MNTVPAADDSAWILDSLFLGPHRRYRRVGSLLLGLAGPFLFALFSCFIAGFLAVWLDSIAPRNTLAGMIAGLVTFLFASGTYFATLLTLHLLASCELPISIRLAMIYLAIFVCWSAAAWPTGEPVTISLVLSTLPFCIGGFLMRWLRGWRTLCWHQGVTKPKMTIFSLLDVTTAVAMAFGLMALREEFADPRGFVCLFPGVVVFSGVGLHVWTRLASLCPIRQYSGTGFGIWMAVNVLWAFVVFVSFAVGFSSSPAGLLGFIAAPGSLLVAHLWTEIPLRWLHGCGWTFIRIDDVEPEKELGKSPGL